MFFIIETNDDFASKAKLFRLVRSVRSLRILKGLRIVVTVAADAEDSSLKNNPAMAEQHDLLRAGAAAYALQVLAMPKATWLEPLTLAAMRLLKALVFAGNSKCQQAVNSMLRGEP